SSNQHGTGNRIVIGSTVDAKNPIGLPIVELAVLRLLASDHGQRYINVAQVPSHRLSKPSCDAGRDHRAPSSTDRAAAYSKGKAACPRSGRSLSLGLALTLVVALAFCPDHCQTGNRHRLASSGISVVLDLEDSPRPIRTSPRFERNSRSDSNHES